MSKSQKEVSNFDLVGQLLGFVIKDGYKIKYLRINSEEREYWLKLEKTLRSELDRAISPGCWLEVAGERKLCHKTGKVKLKATSVKVIGDRILACPLPQANCKAQNESKTSILVCQKSSCWKRGGQQVCQAILDSLRDRGLADRVQIKTTGCLKQCKQGPNLVMLPDKTKYSQVQPEQISLILEKHIASNVSC